MAYEYKSIYVYGMTTDEFVNALNEEGEYGWVFKGFFGTHEIIGNSALLQRYYVPEEDDDDDDEELL